MMCVISRQIYICWLSIATGFVGITTGVLATMGQGLGILTFAVGIILVALITFIAGE